jgi:SAM-dependent methyltransferase
MDTELNPMDNETLFALMVELHRDGLRQGPGSDEETLRALQLTRLDPSATLQVADIGCGTGASTLVLASQLQNAQITAVDLFPEFLEILSKRARAAGCSKSIEPLTASMDALPFAHDSLDLIWSEGAIYNIGFAKGIENWKSILRPGGVLAVSEITWLRPNPPEEIRQHWQNEYPEIATAAEKISILERGGYDLLGYFALPSTAWINHYYEPTELRISAFLQGHRGQSEAEALVKMERHEADLYRRFKDWFSYGFYVARKR